MNTLLSLAFLSVAIPSLIFIGIGVLALADADDLRIAKACFLATGFLVAAKFIHLAVRHGDWSTYPLFGLAIGACGLFCVACSRYVDRKQIAKLEKEAHAKTKTEGVSYADTKRRDFLVERLTDFTKEAGQSSKLGKFYMPHGFLEVGLHDKIERFLKIHLPDKVERFKQKGIDGVEEIISELLGVQLKTQDHSESVEVKEQRHVSLEELEETYEPLKKLEPNFVEFENEYVEAHSDDNGVVVRGPSPGKESFRVLVRPFGNEHPRKKVKSLQKVSFRLFFICFDRRSKGKDARIDIHRGAWLTEASTEVDFPAHCPPRRAVVVTAEGPDSRVYAVRRDSDSSYKSILPLREELTGSIYTVILSLLVESRNSAAFKYILEIIREPGFELRLTDAVTWKSGHLSNFVKEGFEFSTRIHEIWSDAQKQAAFPEPPPGGFSLFRNFALPATEPFDYAAAHELVRSIERDQEGKLLDAMKDWETRTADWVGLFIGAEQGDKLLKSIPSFDDGFNRKQRSRPFIMAPRLKGSLAPPPTLPYWELRDAVSSRISHIMKIIEGLR